MEQITILQTDYERLVEERLTYQEAGMKAKVFEWDYKIKICEASMYYKPTSFSKIVDDLGIQGLNDVIDKRKAHFANIQDQAQELAKKILGSAIYAKSVSEATLWNIIEQNNYRFKSNPLAKIEAIKLMMPKMKGTAKKLLELTFNQEKAKVSNIEVSPDLIAYVKIVTVEDYKADDNPPMEVLKQIVQAKRKNLFSDMVIAYPMVGTVKKIDPIVIGIIKNPNKEYSLLSSPLSFNKFWLDGDAPISFLKSLDWGDMFKITEWI